MMLNSFCRWMVVGLGASGAAVTVSRPVQSQQPAAGTERPEMLEHRVPVVSTVPAIAGLESQLYVRERVLPSVRESAADRAGVVLFVHGAGTPAEVAFDVPYGTYSWMGYLAEAGFDVFAVDMTGYGRSSRPAPMDDPCNLGEDLQDELIPSVLEARCPPSYPHALTTIASDWNDIDAAVEYIRELRGVEQVHMVAWSLGGPRVGGYAAIHPEKVDRLVLLAPAYSRTRRADPPELPAPGLPMGLQDRDRFIQNWDRQVGCANQYEPEVAEAVWQEMLLSDPVGASWGRGYRRAPQTTTWGWNQEIVEKTDAPALIVSPPHDAQVPPERVRELFADFGAEDKLLLDLACTSHSAMWERNHLLLFEASREWLSEGTVEGQRNGTVRLGY
jgi:pimeloyl-ACP methyl ester carboxylesterase